MINFEVRLQRTPCNDDDDDHEQPPGGSGAEHWLHQGPQYAVACSGWSGARRSLPQRLLLLLPKSAAEGRRARTRGWWQAGGRTHLPWPPKGFTTTTTFGGAGAPPQLAAWRMRVATASASALESHSNLRGEGGWGGHAGTERQMGHASLPARSGEWRHGAGHGGRMRAGPRAPGRTRLRSTRLWISGGGGGAGWWLPRVLCCCETSNPCLGSGPTVRCPNRCKSPHTQAPHVRWRPVAGLRPRRKVPKLMH